MCDVPEGYKMSEVGVIPEEWKVKQLGEMAKIIMGQSPKSVFYNTNGEGLPLIQGNADIENRKTIIRTFTSSITKKGKNGDIIMSVRAPVGEIARATFDCCLGRGVCAVSYKNDYLYHYLIHFEKFWTKLSKGSTFDSINSKEVNELEIALPKSDEEQQAIASALSDVDALITALEQLITKKRNIKQGAMQQLLTGEKRLPGFGGEWEVKTFNKIADVRDGTHESPKYHKNGVIFITSKNIIDGKIDFTDINFISEDDATNINQRSKVDKGDILMSMIGTIGNAVLINFEPNFCIKNVALIKPSKVSGNYLIKFLQSQIFQNSLNENIDGGIQKFISLGGLRELNIPIPFPAEQQAIAQVLSDMDTEIEALKQKRNKYKAIKQGMMQELLTGERRLA